MTTSAHCPPSFSAPAPLAPWLQKFAGASLPLTFILLWSSGYVAGKLALPHVGPFTLLVLRFGLAAVVLGLVAWLTRAPWPTKLRDWGHLAVVGLLMQGLHFSGVYYGMRLGVSAGVAGLLIGMMPLATALGGHFLLGERVGRWQMLGLAGGVLGVALVIAGKSSAGGGTSLAAVAVTLLGLLGLVAGTLYQKRFCAGMDLRSGASVQMAVATLAAAALAGPAEGFTVHWHGELVFAVLWLGLVNSIGAFSLLFVMVRRGQAGQVASLFYLIPGVSALMGFALLGERLSLLAVGGFVVSAIAVLACVRKAK